MKNKFLTFKDFINEDGEGGGDFGGGDFGGDFSVDIPDAPDLPDVTPPEPVPVQPPVQPETPQDSRPPLGYGYGSALGLWGPGLMQNLYWIISGERMLERMKEIGLTPEQRKRVKEATDRAKENFIMWLEGRNQMYINYPGWTMMPISTSYGTYKAAVKPGGKAKVAKQIKSKAKKIYAKELRTLPKAARKPLKKKD